MTFDDNEHFKSMRRSATENFAFAVIAVMATVATTMLAVAPARATDADHAAACAATADVAIR
jgi:hypothetical protein